MLQLAHDELLTGTFGKYFIIHWPAFLLQAGRSAMVTGRAACMHGQSVAYVWCVPCRLFKTDGAS
jgi:hypothetical protein